MWELCSALRVGSALQCTGGNGCHKGSEKLETNAALMFTSILFGKLYENIPRFSNFPLTSLSGYWMEADLCPGSSFLLQFTQAYASVKISVYSLYFTTNISSFIFMLEILFLKVKHKCVQKLIIWNTRHFSAPRQHLRTLQKSLCWLAIIFLYSRMYLLSHNMPLLEA